MARGRGRSVQRHTHHRGWAVLGDGGLVVARSRSPLIGRRRELQFVGDRLELARAGRPQGVVITGPAGIGKSRFTREVRENALAMGFHDVALTVGLADGAPFAPLVHELVPLLLESFGGDEAYRTDLALLETLTWPGSAAIDADVWEALPAGTDLLADEPALDDAGGRRTDLLETHRSTVQRLLTLTRLTIEAAQRQPLVIVVDDFHRADPATAAFVDQLLVSADRVARHEEVPLVVVCLVRPEPGTEDRTEDLARLPSCSVVTLSGLDRLECLDMLTALGVDTSRPEIDSVVRGSSGSPLFLEAVSRVMLGPTAGEAWTTVSGIPLPETALEAVTAGLHELPADTREVLADLALLIEPAPAALVTHLLAVEPDELEHRLRPAVDDGLVELDEQGIRFTHGLRRLAAASQRTDAARAARHLELARRLLDDPPDGAAAGALPAGGVTALTAHHLVEAGSDAPPELVHQIAAAAADRCLEEGSPLDAGRYLEAAIATAELEHDLHGLGQLHLDASRAWIGALDVHRASVHAQHAAALFERAGDREQWARAVLLRFRCIVYRATYRAPLPPSDELERVQRDASLPDDLRIEALVTASELAWIQGDESSAAGLADEAHQRAHRAGLPTLAAAALVSRATAAWLRLDLRGAGRLLEEGQRLAEQAGDPVGSSVAAGHAAFTHWLLGRPEEAEASADDALERADEGARQLERAMPLAVKTAISVARGDRSAAELLADEAVLIQRASGDSWAAAFVFGPLAYAATLAGDHPAVRANLLAVRDGVGGATGAGLDRMLVTWARAFMDESRPEDATLVRSLASPEAAAMFPVPAVGVTSIAAALIEATDLLALGPVPEVLHDRISRAESNGQVLCSTLPVLLPRVRATVARLAGDLRTADLAAWQAIEIARAHGLQAELARAHLEAARIAHRRALADDAERHLEAFLGLADDHRLDGLLAVASRLADVPQPERVARAGRLAGAAPGRPVAVVVDVASRSWLTSRAEGSAQQQVRRQVLDSIAQQVEAFSGTVVPDSERGLVAWFPSVRLAVEFAFRAVARGRRRGVGVAAGIEMADGAVSADEALAVAYGLSRLASADEVLTSERARASGDRTPGIEFRHHSSGRVDGAQGHLTILRARLARSTPPRPPGS